MKKIKLGNKVAINCMTHKIQILSPDGFTIEWGVPHYKSHKVATKVFNEWKNRYEIQGYYSSVKYGRIPLEDLENYCQIIYL